MNDALRNEIRKYYAESKKELPFDKVPVSGKVYDENELFNLVEASLEGWWTEGRWAEAFEEKLKKFLDIRYALLVNSGSSANLVAFKTLTSAKLGDRRLKRGDEVITTAACFPTTLNPIIDNGLVPVFVDVDIGTYNALADKIAKAVTKKTKAIMMAHTLGNPFNLNKVKEICEKHKLWLIEDNCDALGSKYDGRLTGTFGDISTMSFYPAHHITTAEGGVVLTNEPQLYKIARSIRDWGRDCWCSTGKDNTCGKRFKWKLGGLPEGYDHKYIYSELGYNLKMTDLQASIGLAQMDKLDFFIKKRKENFTNLLGKLSEFEKFFILPKATENSEPSWFGFPLTVKEIDRSMFLHHLNAKGISTRLLFAGNVTKQPYFSGFKYKIAEDLRNTDLVMTNTFWIGVYPGLREEHLNYVYDIFTEYFKK